MLGKRLAQLPGTGRARGRASEAAPTASVRVALAVAQRVPPAVPESGRRAPPGALWPSLVLQERHAAGARTGPPFLGSPMRKAVAAPACGPPAASTRSACQAGSSFPGAGVPERRFSGGGSWPAQPGGSCSLELYSLRPSGPLER